MSEFDRYVIDFTKAENWRDIHPIIAEALNFPEWYGCNLDALDEFLTEIVLSERSLIEIRGLEKLKEYNGYDKKIYKAFLSAKYTYGKDESCNFQVRIMWEDGSIEVFPDELPIINFNLDFSDVMTEDDVISEFDRAFGFDPKDTNDFTDVWHELLQALFIRISVVEIRGLEKLKNVGDTYEITTKILRGIKENWNNKYSNRIFVTIVHENGERENLE